MRTILILCLVILLSGCQASGSSNGRNGNANFIASVLSLEF